MSNNFENTAPLYQSSGEKAVFEGIISIEAVINAGKREIFNIYCDADKIKKRDRKAMHFLKLLKEKNFPYTMLSREEIDAIAKQHGISASHGGFIAFTGVRTYTEFEEYLNSLKSARSYAVYLDGVEDPFNFGYSVRNLFAFGAHGFIIPKRNWLSASGTVCRSSAGASELSEITIAPDDDEAMKLIKSNGIKIVCAALSQNSVPIGEFEPEYPFILFIGGEKRGISKLFYENSDAVVHIPYSNENAKYSLPTASAAAIFGSFIAYKKQK